jgi:hypothetical protein
VLTRFQILYFVIVPWKWFTPRQRWRPSRPRLLRRTQDEADGNLLDLLNKLDLKSAFRQN